MAAASSALSLGFQSDDTGTFADSSNSGTDANGNAVSVNPFAVPTGSPDSSDSSGSTSILTSLLGNAGDILSGGAQFLNAVKGTPTYQVAGSGSGFTLPGSKTPLSKNVIYIIIAIVVLVVIIALTRK